MSTSDRRTEGAAVAAGTPAVPDDVFAVIEAHGPRTIEELAGRSFTGSLLAATFAKSLLVIAPVLGIGFGGLAIMEYLYHQVPGVAWSGIFGGVAVLFGLFCPAVTSRFAFRPADLVNVLRRKRFAQLWLVAAAAGFFAGFGISFLISEKPGVLLPADFSRNMVIILSCALVAGQITGIMAVRAGDSQDLQNVRSWIAAWNNRAVHPSPRSGNEV